MPIPSLSALPTPAYPLAVGLFANSLLFFGNVGLGLAGPVPITRGHLAGSETTKLGAKQKVALWNVFYDSAKVSQLCIDPARLWARHSSPRPPVRA